MIKITLTIVKLLAIAIFAIFFDFFLFAFTKTCVSCGSFTQFLSSSHSLFTPTWAGLVAIVYQMKGKK